MLQDGKTCSLVGDAHGNLPDTKWVPTMNGFTKSGGPMHWIRSKLQYEHYKHLRRQQVNSRRFQQGGTFKQKIFHIL